MDAWGWTLLGTLSLLLLLALGYIVYLHRNSPRGSGPGGRVHAAKQNTGNEAGRQITVGMTISFLAYAILFFGVIAAVVFSRRSIDSSLSLPILLIAGVGVFLDTIAGMSLVFWRIGLSDRRYPLGMPDGSIRAIIALSLILLFAIMAIFLYVDVGDVNKNAARVDIAKQLVTTLSTLVVALASFYFGASSFGPGTDQRGDARPPDSGTQQSPREQPPQEPTPDSREPQPDQP